MRNPQTSAQIAPVTASRGLSEPAHAAAFLICDCCGKAMVGVSRQSLAALLGRLRRERVIENRYARLVILDFEKLKQKCGREMP